MSMSTIESEAFAELKRNAPRKLREWTERVAHENKELRLQLAEQNPKTGKLAVENAMLRAGLDVDSPAGKLFLTTYDGPAEPQMVREAFTSLTASVLATRLSAGATLHDLADEADDAPTEAEKQQQHLRRALVGDPFEGQSR